MLKSGGAETIPSVKLVIAEDDVNVAAVLEARLQTLGYHVCAIARSGRAAVRCTIEHQPDLVLMDIILEGDLNGIEAAEAIQKQMDVPIVFITCLSDQRIFDRAINANAYGYILKPYDNAELKYTLRVALIKHAAAKEREKLIEKLEQALSERKRIEEALRVANEKLEQKVVERTRLEEARTKQLQAVAVELIEAEERERRRISELLHDDLQQILAAARFQLEAVCEKLPDVTELSDIKGLLSDSISRTRQLSHELSPTVLHQLGLIAALKWLCTNMSEQFGLNVELSVNEPQRFENTSMRIFIFRAVQELLFNVVKHAGVKNARIELVRSADKLDVIVSDEGQGFDPAALDSIPEKAGLGLLRLRERAGYMGISLKIESAPGQGSRFTLSLP